MQDRRHIARQGFAKVRIEIRQDGTIKNQVQIERELRSLFRGNPQSRLANVALDDFDALGDKLREPAAKLLLQWIKYRRLFENFLKAPLRGRHALAADQQVDLA